ncbi:MAG: hypothetical protein QGI78_08670 [Phycisphaerales bacterium]|jgi:hypothetical protein|nr:hypothetical protein [Phycisphaerales bacterium]
MPNSANVKSLDALQEFRSALIDFIDKAKRATTTAESEISHMQGWLSNTQLMHWKYAIRKREEKLAQAKSELFRATISQPDNPRGPTDQVRLVRRRKEEVEHAKKKLHNTQRWGRILEHENHEYRAAMTPLTASLEGELQKAVAKIDNAIVALELYLADQVVEAEKLPSPTDTASIARRGDEQKETTHEHGECQRSIDESNEETPPQMG